MNLSWLKPQPLKLGLPKSEGKTVKFKFPPKWYGGATITGSAKYEEIPMKSKEGHEGAVERDGLHDVYREDLGWPPVELQSTRCLRGEHEAVFTMEVLFRNFTSVDGGFPDVPAFGVCRHCRAVFVPR